MNDADELLLVAEGDDALPVLKPDRSRGPKVRSTKAHEFVEENATFRVDSTFWHELEAVVRLRHLQRGIIVPHIRARATRRNRGSHRLCPEKAATRRIRRENSEAASCGARTASAKQ
jgi:hypothetical protein